MTSSILLVALCLSLQNDVSFALDGRKQLFLDDYLIASSENVTRTIHAARKHPKNPLLRATKPWEDGVAIVYGSVLREGDGYRAWYYASGNLGYAESVDGIQWTKPPLGIIKIDGQDTNLLVRRGGPEGEPGTIPHFYEVFGVHRDDREPDPARRYKMGYLSLQRNYFGLRQGKFHMGQRRGLGVAASPDGIHWQPIKSWATESICDGGTHWTWDQATGKYLLYGRTKYVDPEVKEAWSEYKWVREHFWGRAVARVESADFVDWNITQPDKAPVVMSVDMQDTPGDEIYSMHVFPYESVYIGLVQVFHNREDTCDLEIQLAVSHDSINFTRVGDRQPFIPVGPVGSWDRFNNSVANNPPIVVGDQLHFYYGGRTYRHGPYNGKDAGERGGSIGLATVKRDRFVSLGASFDGGQIITKPLVLGGRDLHLNAKSDFGRIVVEALNPAGQLIARSQPIREDGLDLRVVWEDGGLEGVEGPVHLRIKLQNALLFALWCSAPPFDPLAEERPAE